MLLMSLLHALSAAAVTIPHPNGTYGVDISTIKLTDTSRLDPFAPTLESRSVMTSLFYPAAQINKCQFQLLDYMPPTTAAFEDEAYSSYGLPNGTFESLKLSLCSALSGSASIDLQEFPIVLFSPGHGGSRLLYNAMAQSVASHGFIVITMDHPYDPDIVEYPDGTVVLAANISTDAQIILDVETRARDTSFVLDYFKEPCDMNSLPLFLKKGLNTDKVAMFGHSLGGATAATAMMNDSRIAVGINLDGAFWGSVIENGVRNPFLIFGHEGHNQSTDSTWGDIWPHLGHDRLELTLNGSEHATFVDFPLLLEVLGLTDELPGAVKLLGSLPGTRAMEIITTYVRAFLKFGLGYEKSALLRGPSSRFPEVAIVAR